MADTPAMARLRGGHYNTSDWNASTNPGGMGGDGHRYAMIPPKAPQTPTYPVMVNDMVAVLDEAAASANAAAGSASAASAVLSNAQALLSNATLDGTSDCSTTMTVAADPKGLTVATNKAFRPGHEVQATRKSSPTTWLRGTVTDYNAGTGALYVSMTSVSAPNGIGPFSDWTVSTVSRQDATGGAATVAMTGALTLTNASARVQALDPNGASRDVLLPAANSLANTGGPIHIIRNAMVETGALYVLDIRDNAGTFLRSLYPGDVAYVSLLSRASAAGTWDIVVINRDEGGAAVNMAMSGDLVLDRRIYRSKVFHLAPTDANRSVTLPAATSVEFLGGPLWYIRNAATSFPLTVRNGAGTVLARLLPQQTAVISCYNRSSAAGGWAVDVISNDPNGGVGNVSLTADFNMSAWGPRTLRCTPDANGRSINLPDATTYATAGGPVAYIVNHSATSTISLRTSVGSTILRFIGPGQMATVHLLDRSSPQGTWFVVIDNAATQMNESLLMTTVSGRQAQSTNGYTYNHKLSITNTSGKVLWSYTNLVNNSLCARILTVTGASVSAGAENVLVSINGTGAGQAVALSDSYGIAVFSNGTDVYSQGISINLSTGAVALAGSANGWGIGSIDSSDIRLDRVPSNNACIVEARRSDTTAGLIRLLCYDGSTLTSSSTAINGNIERYDRHDIVAVSSTEARQFRRAGDQMGGRTITMSLSNMTVSVGSETGTGSGSDCTDIYAAAADATWTITHYMNGSGQGAYARAWNGTNPGPEVTLAGNASAYGGATLMWSSTSGVFLYADHNGSNRVLYAQPFTLQPTASPYISIDTAKRITLNSSAGLAKNDPYHRTTALALSPLTGLLLFCDEGNSNYPTIVVVERSL